MRLGNSLSADKQLKTCPFCGGKVYPAYSSKTQRYYFYHYHGREECVIEEFTMMGDRFGSLAEAEAAWNRRAE